MQLHDLSARVLDHGEHQGAAYPAPARLLAHVDPPEHALVPFFGKRGDGEAGHANQAGPVEGAEHRLALEAARDLGQALADLLVMARRKRAGMPDQSLQTQRLEGRRIVRAKPSHTQVQRILPTD